MGLSKCTGTITQILVNKVWFENLSRKVKTKELNKAQISQVMNMLFSTQELISSAGEIRGDFYPIDPKWPTYILTLSDGKEEELVRVKGNLVMFEDGSSEEVIEEDLSNFLEDVLADTRTEKKEIRILLG